MDNDCIIELKRALYKVAEDYLADRVINYSCNFYPALFEIYKQDFIPCVIKEKQLFVQKATSYLIFNRLSQYIKRKNKLFYIPLDITFEDFDKILIEHIKTVFSIMSYSYIDFEEQFAKTFHIKQNHLIKYLEVNRSDSLSSFDKAVEKIYFYNLKKKK